MYRAVRIGVLCASASVACGCATVVHGTRQTVKVTSDPPGAAVIVLSHRPGRAPIERSRPGVTPIELDLTRRDPNIVIRLERDGCPPVDLRLKRSVSGWVALDLFVANPYARQGMSNPSPYLQQIAVGVPLTFGVDALTGGAFKLPKAVHASVCP
jgi:hypothetical protein